jgi:hypothetical protein
MTMMKYEIVFRPGQDPVRLLCERIPEFKERLDQNDLDLPYVVFGFFAQYLRTLAPKDPVFEKAIEFLNATAEMGNAELCNLLQVAIFESIADDQEFSGIVKARLRVNAMELFTAAERAIKKF